MPRTAARTASLGGCLLFALLFVPLVNVPAVAARPWCQPGWRARVAPRAAVATGAVRRVTGHAVDAQARFVLVYPTLEPVAYRYNRRGRYDRVHLGYRAIEVGTHGFPWGWFGARMHDDLSVRTGYYEDYKDWSWFFSN